MSRLTGPILGFVAALALAAAAGVAAASGAIPGVSLAVDWPPLIGSGIVHRPLSDTELKAAELSAPDDARVAIERFAVQLPAGSYDVWAETYEHGKGTGRAFETHGELNGEASTTLMLALIEATNNLELVVDSGSQGWRGGVRAPIDLVSSSSMSSSLHVDPTGIATGDAVPLVWKVWNGGDGADPLPEDFRKDPAAAMADPGPAFAAYDYALVIWCRFNA